MKIILSIIITFLLSTNAYAAPDDLIVKFQQTYQNLQAFQADFDQTLTHQESQTSEQRQGNILFMKPLLLRFETYKPNDELLIVGENEIWDYLASEELAYKYSLELAQDSKSLISVITGQNPLTTDFEVEKQENEDNYAKFLLYPYEPSSQLVEATLWLDPETALIKRVRIMDLFGNLNIISFKNTQIKDSVDLSNFNFTPPSGTEVEDLTDPDNTNTRALFN